MSKDKNRIIKLRPVDEDYLIRPKEVVFPSLEEVAKEFAEKNKTGEMNVSPYCINFGRIDCGRRNENGLILTFEKGKMVLRNGRTEMGEQEDVVGGFPVKIWRVEYLMGGIYANDGELPDMYKKSMIAILEYQQNQKQVKVEDEDGVKRFEWKPYGKIERNVWRRDEEKLWFLVNREDSGRAIV